MRKEYDLSDAIRHPLAGKFNGKFTAIVHYDIKDNNELQSDTQEKESIARAEAVSEHQQKYIKEQHQTKP